MTCPETGGVIESDVTVWADIEGHGWICDHARVPDEVRTIINGWKEKYGRGAIRLVSLTGPSKEA